MSAPRRPYSIGLRLSWMFAALSLLGCGLLAAGIYVAAAWSMAERAEAELSRKTDLVMRLVKEAGGSGDMPTLRHKLDEFFLRYDNLHVTLTRPGGTVAYESPGRAFPMAARRSAAFELDAASLAPELAAGSVLLDRSADERLLGGLATMLALATVAAAFALSLSGFWLVRRSLAPLEGLAEQTRALGVDNLGGRLAMDPPARELQPWIDQFNDLMERVDYAYRQSEAFNADVAHELRTPLATLTGQTEIALSRPRQVDELRDTLGSNLEEVRRLSSIVNDMLFLARADRGVAASAGPLGTLSVEARKVLEFQEAPLAEKSLTARVEGDVLAVFEPGLARRAISNLVGNAIQYATPGSEIVIALRRRDGQAWVDVSNRGPELATASLPRIFDRFFRAGSAREGGDEHHGLGLAIVAAIARMHGGTTRASSAGGLTTIGFSLAERSRLAADESPGS